VSSAEEARGLLTQLEAQRDTGCLTITSADGLVCQVYLVAGRAFHAVGPMGEGESALDEALDWPDVTLSFDDRAGLPDKQTIGAASLAGVTIRRATDPSSGGAAPMVQVRLFRSPIEPSAGPKGSLGISALSDDPRLTKMSLAAVAGGCLVVIVPVLLFGVAALLSNRGINSDGVATASVILLPVLFVAWLVVYVGYRVVFFRDAVSIPDSLPKAMIPHVVDAPIRATGEEPGVVIKMRTRSTVGKLGKCRIEFYSDGLQIWRGARHPEPRWQFAYRDLLQAESVELMYVSGKGDSRQYFVRLIVGQPRMAFLFGNSWTVNRTAKLLVDKLREHKVTMVSETLTL
jgi:hypothetical protein